jgi:hypothetical protein
LITHQAAVGQCLTAELAIFRTIHPVTIYLRIEVVAGTGITDAHTEDAKAVQFLDTARNYRDKESLSGREHKKNTAPRISGGNLMKKMAVVGLEPTTHGL